MFCLQYRSERRLAAKGEDADADKRERAHMPLSQDKGLTQYTPAGPVEAMYDIL